MGDSTFPGEAASWADVSPLTTRGDLIVSTAATVVGARLAVGAENQLLQVDGSGDAIWTTPAGGGGYGEFCVAFNEAAVACATGTMTPIAMEAEKIDSDSMHVTTGSAAEMSRITFTTAGTYCLIAHARTAAVNADWELYILDGDGPTELFCTQERVTNSVSHVVELVAYVTQTAASYVSMHMKQDAGSTQDVSGWTGSGSYSMPMTYFAAARIG